MSFQFVLLIGIQLTFVLGLGWFWLEQWGDEGRIPRAGWLVASIPVAAFGLGVMAGPELAVTSDGTPTVQDTIAFVTMWGCYFVGAVVTLFAATAQRESA